MIFYQRTPSVATAVDYSGSFDAAVVTEQGRRQDAHTEQ